MENDLHICWAAKSQLRSKLFPQQSGLALPAKPNQPFILQKNRTSSLSIQLCVCFCTFGKVTIYVINRITYGNRSSYSENILSRVGVGGQWVTMHDLLLVFRDGRANSNGRSDTEGSAERAERRGDAAGDGALPLCVFGQGPTWLLFFFSYWVEQCIDQCHNGSMKKERQKITNRLFVVMLRVTDLF